MIRFTAKRLRPEAQGCFNPGNQSRPNSNRNAVASWMEMQEWRNRVAVEIRSRLLPGLKQPWALGRNRFAVKSKVRPFFFTQSLQIVFRRQRKCH